MQSFIDNHRSNCQNLNVIVTSFRIKNLITMGHSSVSDGGTRPILL